MRLQYDFRTYRHYGLCAMMLFSALSTMLLHAQEIDHPPFAEGIQVLSAADIGEPSESDVYYDTANQRVIVDGKPYFMLEAWYGTRYSRLYGKIYFRPPYSDYDRIRLTELDLQTGEVKPYTLNTLLPTLCGDIFISNLTEWVIVEHEDRPPDLCHLETGETITNFVPSNLPPDQPSEFEYGLNVPTQDYVWSKGSVIRPLNVSADGEKLALLGFNNSDGNHRDGTVYVVVYNFVTRDLSIVSPPVPLFTDDISLRWKGNDILILSSSIGGQYANWHISRTIIRVSTQQILAQARGYLDETKETIRWQPCPEYSITPVECIEHHAPLAYPYVLYLDRNEVVYEPPRCNTIRHSETRQVDNVEYNRVIHAEGEETYAEIVATDMITCAQRVIVSGQIEQLLAVTDDHHYLVYGLGTTGILDNRGAVWGRMPAHWVETSPQIICIHDLKQHVDVYCFTQNINSLLAFLDGRLWLLGRFELGYPYSNSWLFSQSEIDAGQLPTELKPMQITPSIFRKILHPFALVDLAHIGSYMIARGGWILLSYEYDEVNTSVDYHKLALYHTITGEFVPLTDDFITPDTFTIEYMSNRRFRVTEYHPRTAPNYVKQSTVYDILLR